MTSSHDQDLVIAKDFDHLVTLFYSDIYFQAQEMVKDEELAKAMSKKVFEVARDKFDHRHNNLPFLQKILHGMTTYVHSDEKKLSELGTRK